MRHSSLRGNLLWLAGIYFVSLVVASGCPSSDAPPNKPTATPASINPPEPSVDDALRSVDAPPAELAPVESKPLVPAAATQPVTVKPAAPPQVKEPALLPENPNEPQTSITFKGPAIPIDASSAGQSGDNPGDDFQGWGKPQLALVLTGEQNGYMEPCGCAGLENMKGGIGRRHDMIQQLKAKGWPVAAVDVGGLVGQRTGVQAELKFEKSAEALRQMGYQAVGLGVDDLRLKIDEVAVKASPNGPDASIFCSSNAGVLGLVPKSRIFTVGGLKFGVAAVLNESNQTQLKGTEVELTNADTEIKNALKEFKDCDHRILLAIAPIDSKIEGNAKELASKYPEFDIVVTGGMHGDPPHLLRNATGKVLSNLNGSPLNDASGQIFVETGDKGMFAIVLGFYPGEKLPHYQRVALDKRYHVTPAMKQIMKELQDNYASLGWDGLGVKTRPHTRGQFVGSASCRKCHEDAFKIWQASGHGHASDTLMKLDPERMHDAECVACHVTGWNPKDKAFEPYETGFLSLKDTPHLVGNGCENCHGPGAAHVAAEEGKDAGLQGTLRSLMHIDLKQAEKSCKDCHDHDNSPEFSKKGFDHYWDKIAH